MDKTLSHKNETAHTLMQILDSNNASSPDDRIIRDNNPEPIEKPDDSGDELFPDFKK